MIRFQYLVYIVSMMSSFLGCSQEKTLLSDEIKKINPYKEGQILTFVSSDGDESLLRIQSILESQFPDAIGAPNNESLSVIAYRDSKTIRSGTEVRVFALFAKTKELEEQIDFSLSLKETSINMRYVAFSDYQNKSTFQFDTEFDHYDDIVFFENYPNRKIYESEIVEFYWSKSKGYIRLVQKNGVTWDLKDIK